MTTSPKKPSLPQQQDKSDVLSLLLSIESMYDTCQNVLNTYSQTALVLSMAIEAQMLLMKLRVMKNRWNYHLPFKEACLVDFYDWSKKIEKTRNHSTLMISNRLAMRRKTIVIPPKLAKQVWLK